MRFVILVLAGVIGGCAADPAARQRVVDSVQKQCLDEAKGYVETGMAKDYFTRCVDSRLSALGEDPVYDRAFGVRWPEFGNRTTGEILEERSAGSRPPALGPVAPGQPFIDAYGRPRQFVPSDGGGGAPLGPIIPNAYGPGVHMDATGRPVRSVPWP
jgi:hypothetical protein